MNTEQLSPTDQVWKVIQETGTISITDIQAKTKLSSNQISSALNQLHMFQKKITPLSPGNWMINTMR